MEASHHVLRVVQILQRALPLRWISGYCSSDSHGVSMHGNTEQARPNHEDIGRSQPDLLTDVKSESTPPPFTDSRLSAVPDPTIIPPAPDTSESSVIVIVTERQPVDSPTLLVDSPSMNTRSRKRLRDTNTDAQSDASPSKTGRCKKARTGDEDVIASVPRTTRSRVQPSRTTKALSQFGKRKRDAVTEDAEEIPISKRARTTNARCARTTRSKRKNGASSPTPSKKGKQVEVVPERELVGGSSSQGDTQGRTTRLLDPLLLPFDVPITSVRPPCIIITTPDNKSCIWDPEAGQARNIFYRLPFPYPLA